ncbi:hypothetical protein [Candidatus Tisiphia endosymbiont of Beris chalybata]|uniref:hypothetical protein n=1 Tax=Candidatus Tisiphia endosymbiont of Beris chalybata TaxID=3066262 RepID=UPI00312C7F4E
MSTAKTASKNNPTSREQAKEYFYQGKEIKPVKLITNESTRFAAEYKKSGDLVVGADSTILPWVRAKN